MTDVIRGFSGSQKAALVLMQMGRERAAEVLRLLSPEDAEELAAQVARLSTVEDEVAQAALVEFATRATAPTRPHGGREAAEKLLEATFGAERAQQVLGRMTPDRPFEFLDAADPAVITALLADELPETIALVLIHLSSATSSGVLGRLDPEARVAVAQAIAGGGSASPDAVTLLADTIRQLVRGHAPSEEAREVTGGVQPLVDILNRSDPETERTILAELEERDPLLAAEVRSRMFAFEDLVELEARDIQQVLRGLDPTQLALALKGAPEEISSLILGNISDRNRESVETEQGYLGAVRKSQVEAARSEIVKVVRGLQAEGTIRLKRDAEEAEQEEELVD